MSEPDAHVVLARHPHHLEHLAPIADLMSATVLVPTDDLRTLAHRWYPSLRVRHDPSPPSGTQVFYYSHLYTRPELRKAVAPFARIRHVVHCPHGFSEKVQRWSEMAAEQDITLLYGQANVDQLASWDALDRLGPHLVVGNLLRRYYNAHRLAMNDTWRSRFASRFDDSRLWVLYAPTWEDEVGSSSLPQLLPRLVEARPAACHVMIRPHPNSLREPATRAWLQQLCNRAPGVLLLDEWTPLWPVLSLAAVYVGDMSALAYDALGTDGPMVLLNQTAGTATDVAGTRLFGCGRVLTPRDYDDIWHVVDEELASGGLAWRPARRATHDWVYDPHATGQDLRQALERLLDAPAPQWLTASDRAEPHGAAAGIDVADSTSNTATA